MATGEIVVPFRVPEHKLGRATQVRTTLLVSSLQSLRKRGYLDAYLDRLPPEHHGAIQSMIAGQWTSIAIGRAHYLACEALGLSQPEMNAIGREVGDRIEGTFLALVVRMAGSAGLTPWAALEQMPRLYDRIFAGGGGGCLLRRGPKDARAQMTGCGLADIPYFAAAITGVFEVGAELFCKKAYARPALASCTPNSVVLDIAWA
jgi:hypothetical protein